MHLIKILDFDKYQIFPTECGFNFDEIMRAYSEPIKIAYSGYL